MARKTKGLQTRSKFIILTNGKETEKNYFESLRGFRRSIYDVKVKFINGDPIKLVERAVTEKQTSNQVWIVFDKDEFPVEAIDNTLRLARKNGIRVAFSNAAFEVWLINHFKEYNRETTAHKLVQVLDELLKNEGYTAGYHKNDLEVIQTMFLPYIDRALNNADVSLQKRIAEYDQTHPHIALYPYCEWNSCTTVHKLVEAMKLEPKE